MSAKFTLGQQVKLKTNNTEMFVMKVQPAEHSQGEQPETEYLCGWKNNVNGHEQATFPESLLFTELVPSTPPAQVTLEDFTGLGNQPVRESRSILG